MRKIINKYIEPLQVSDPIFEVRSRENFGIMIEEMPNAKTNVPQTDDVVEAVVCQNYVQDWDRKSKRYNLNKARIVERSMKQIVADMLNFYEVHSEYVRPHLTKTYKWLTNEGIGYFENAEDSIHLYRYIRSFWDGSRKASTETEKAETAIQIIELIKEKHENR